MWPNLESEMDAFKQSCYSDWYREFRNKLPSGSDAEKRRKREFLEVENSFLYLISYVISRYQDDGWGKDTEYPQLLTSHMVRLLTDMKVSLNEHWNSSGANRPGPSEPRGNLYRSSEMLINKFEPPKKADDRFAMWGTDFWDDCYIALSLFKVRQQLLGINRPKSDEFDDQWDTSRPWLRAQVRNKFRTVARFSSWFGPAFHAAAIELFDYLQQSGTIKVGPRLIASVVKDVAPIIRRATGKRRSSWDNRFAWQAGQLIVAWKEKRDRYSALQAINDDMEKLYNKLKALQKPDGAWRFDINATNTNYYTVRGLAACYVMEKDNGNGLVDSTEIRLATIICLSRRIKPSRLAATSKPA